MRPRAETLLTAPAGSRLPGAAGTRRQRRGDADGAAGRAPRQQGAPPPTCLCPAPRGPSRAGLCMLQLLAGVRAGGGSPPGRAPLGAPRESRLSPLRPPRRPSLCPAGAAKPLCIPHRVSAAPAAGEPLPRRPRWGTAAPPALPGTPRVLPQCPQSRLAAPALLRDRSREGGGLAGPCPSTGAVRRLLPPGRTWPRVIRDVPRHSWPVSRPR